MDAMRERYHGNDQKGAFQVRERRISDAIQLKIPDRVPIMLELSYFPAKYAGIPCEAAYYDYDTWLKASSKTVEDFAPDMVQITPFFPGEVYEMLDSKQLKVPGRGIDSHHSHQFIEGEYLRPMNMIISWKTILTFYYGTIFLGCSEH